MSLTKERINEIKEECFGLFRRGMINQYEMFDIFLSHIREGQEPYGYRIENHVAITFTRNKETYESCGGFPLSTIPPAAPDCKELVEALEWIIRLNSWKEIHIIAQEALAKHKASMGEK